MGFAGAAESGDAMLVRSLSDGQAPMPARLRTDAWLAASAEPTLAVVERVARCLRHLTDGVSEQAFFDMERIADGAFFTRHMHREGAPG